MSIQRIRKGSTFRLAMRWEQPVWNYVPITGITGAAPAVITANSHGMPDGWRFILSGLSGAFAGFNGSTTNPKAADFRVGKVLSGNTVEVNSINAAGLTFSGTGVLAYKRPLSLAGVTAKMQFRDKVGGTLLFELSTGDGSIVVDPNGRTVATITPAMTANLVASRGVYDMELYFPDGTELPYPVRQVIFEKGVTQ